MGIVYLETERRLIWLRGETGKTTADPRIRFDKTLVATRAFPLKGRTNYNSLHHLKNTTPMFEEKDIHDYTPEEIDEIMFKRLESFLDLKTEVVHCVNEAGIRTRELHISGDTYDTNIKIIIPDEIGFLNALSGYLHILMDKRYSSNAGA